MISGRGSGVQEGASRGEETHVGRGPLARAVRAPAAGHGRRAVVRRAECPLVINITLHCCKLAIIRGVIFIG